MTPGGTLCQARGERFARLEEEMRETRRVECTAIRLTWEVDLLVRGGDHVLLGVKSGVSKAGVSELYRVRHALREAMERRSRSAVMAGFVGDGAKTPAGARGRSGLGRQSLAGVSWPPTSLLVGACGAWARGGVPVGLLAAGGW